MNIIEDADRHHFVKFFTYRIMNSWKVSGKLLHHIIIIFLEIFE